MQFTVETELGGDAVQQNCALLVSLPAPCLQHQRALRPAGTAHQVAMFSFRHAAGSFRALLLCRKRPALGRQVLPNHGHACAQQCPLSMLCHRPLRTHANAADAAAAVRWPPQQQLDLPALLLLLNVKRRTTSYTLANCN